MASIAEVTSDTGSFHSGAKSGSVDLAEQLQQLQNGTLDSAGFWLQGPNYIRVCCQWMFLGTVLKACVQYSPIEAFGDPSVQLVVIASWFHMQRHVFRGSGRDI